MYGSGNGGDSKLLALQQQIRKLRDKTDEAISGIRAQLQQIAQQMAQQLTGLSYGSLSGKPRINNVELEGNVSLAELGIQEPPTVPTIGYVDDASARDYTLTGGGYYHLGVPSTLPNGAMVFEISIVSYTSATGSFDPKPYGTGGVDAYIIGDPNAEIRALMCRYWYIK